MSDKFIIVVLILLVLNVEHVHGRVIPRTSNQLILAEEYLQKYGYLRESEDVEELSRGGSTDSSVRRAFLLFQRLAKLPETGVADETTLRKMSVPRCGVPDIMPDDEDESARRVKRYVLSGSKWNQNTLTYKIYKYTRDMSSSAQREIFANAFGMWSEVTPLRFQYANLLQRTNINIGFVRGDHGDGVFNRFDGPGNGLKNILAHAFLPGAPLPLRGRIHFDDDDKWAIGIRHGTDLLQVAVHEIGHALGLKHSFVEDSIMHANYKPSLTTVELHSDDIAGIQAIYGSAVNEWNR